MNTELSVEELIEPLQTVIGVVEKKQTLPILSHVLIQLKGNKLTLTTTDMELEISASNKIKSDTEITFTIYAKDLIDIVRKLPEKTQIKFKIEENKVYLNANKNTFELNTFNHLDFPALPKTQNSSIIKIKQDTLKQLIENTSFSMGNQEHQMYTYWQGFLGCITVLLFCQFVLVHSDPACSITNEARNDKCLITNCE